MEPRVIVAAVKGASDLRMDANAREANELINETPELEKIEKAMNEVNESAPRADGVRIGYVWMTCEEVKRRVIVMV